MAAAKELLQEGHAVTVYEQGPEDGGVWAYSEDVEDDLLGSKASRRRVHGSMYAGLRTNLPREIMAFTDFPFDHAFMGSWSRDARRFPVHQEVLSYLRAYSAYYQLQPYVRFGTRVERVEPATSAQQASGNAPASSSRTNGTARPQQWAVTVASSTAHAASTPSGQGASWAVGRSLAGASGSPSGSQHTSHTATGGFEQRSGTTPTAGAGASTSHSGPGPGSSSPTQLFDAVVVANGHYSEPNIPSISGAHAFPGLQMHSHNYRSPRAFAGQRVLLVGASNSGEDISREVAGVAARVLVGARAWQAPGTAWGPGSPAYGPHGNMTRHAMLSSLGSDGMATFEDGTTEGPIDTVIYCTGYTYSFPFLAGDAAAVHVVEQDVRPLWRFMLSPGLGPGLSFIGLPAKIVPFPFCELQARYMARVLSGRVSLPSREEMEADMQAHYARMQERGIAMRHSLILNLEQFPYAQWLVDSMRAGAGADDDDAEQQPGTSAAAEGPAAGSRPAGLAPWREAMYRATGALKRALPEAYRDEQQYDEQLLHAAYSDIRGQVARMSGSPSGTLDHVLAARAQAIQPDGAAATAVITPRL